MPCTLVPYCTFLVIEGASQPRWSIYHRLVCLVMCFLTPGLVINFARLRPCYVDYVYVAQLLHVGVTQDFAPLHSILHVYTL